MISLIFFFSIGCTHTNGSVQSYPSKQSRTYAINFEKQKMDWQTSFEPGFVYSLGRGRFPDDGMNFDQAMFRARRAAIDNGFANLLLELERIKHVDSALGNLPAANSTTTYRKHGILKHVEIISERVLNNHVYQVLMRVPYHKK
jgi:hypothetical protein